MSLVARHLEAEGIPTVIMACARDITASAFPPRVVFCNYPLGNPAGRPFDPENQRAVIEAALDLLESAPGPGTIVDLPHAWQGDPDWSTYVYDDNH